MPLTNLQRLGLRQTSDFFYAVSCAFDVDLAEGDSLTRIGLMADIERKSGETDVKLRKRIKGEGEAG